MWESSSVSPSVSLEISWRRRLLYLLVVVVRILEKKVDDMVGNFLGVLPKIYGSMGVESELCWWGDLRWS
jgi:hypothetical protein